MSYKVAIATSDTVTVENNFGRAEVFSVYTVHDDFTYTHDENRPRLPAEASHSESQALPEEFLEIAASSTGGCGVGRGGGCGSGGCGGGGYRGPIDSKLAKVAETLSDVEIVIAGTLGPRVEAAFAQRGIRSFAVEGFVTKALDKLVAFDKFQHKRRVASGRA
jgi:predicted Fe-Mo cluster-binding NifX family protein